MIERWFLEVAGSDPLMQALVGGLVVAGLNLVGALLVVVWRDPSQRSLDAALGFAAGVMLAASFTSLILPGIEFGGENGLLEVIAGIILGVALLDRADRWVPHVHVLITGRQRSDQTISQAKLAPLLLFIVAITIHNMPEGLAVGVGFGSGNVEEGLALMLAIGIQNIPEGLAVSVAAVNAGFDRTSYAALTGIRAGLVEIPMVILGAWAVTVSGAILPYAMGFAAGGMLFVISDEIVPETHSNGHERVATLGLMAGVIVMLYLDVTLAG